MTMLEIIKAAQILIELSIMQVIKNQIEEWYRK